MVYVTKNLVAYVFAYITKNLAIKPSLTNSKSPKCKDIFDSLDEQEWFSTVDMSKAYHQDYIKDGCRKHTAFSTSFPLYEWIRIPYGLTNTLLNFQ